SNEILKHAHKPLWAVKTTPMKNLTIDDLTEWDVFCLTRFQEENLDFNELYGHTNSFILKEIENYQKNSNKLIRVNNEKEFLNLIKKNIKGTYYDIKSIVYYPFFVTKSLKLRIGQVKLNCYSQDISTLKHD